MEQKDFDQIIIDFFPQESRETYFEIKSKEVDCDLLEFGIKLFKSWINFHEFLFIPNCYKSILTSPNGKRSCYIGPSEGNPSQQKKILEELGELMFLATKTMDIPKNDFGYLGQITLNISNELDNKLLDFFHSFISPLIPELELPYKLHNSSLQYDITPVAPVFEFPQESSNETRLVLKDFFTSAEVYEKFIDVLVKNEYCHSETKFWKDFGPNNKGLLVAIIKGLQPLGYYKNHKRPSNKEIEMIIKNTFAWNVGIDTIKSTKPEDFELKFLPPSTKIQ